MITMALIAATVLVSWRAFGDRRLMDRLYGGQPDARLDYDNVPSVVFSHPPLGSVGLSEEQARERFDSVSTYHSRFRPMLQTLIDCSCRFGHERLIPAADDPESLAARTRNFHAGAAFASSG